MKKKPFFVLGGLQNKIFRLCLYLVIFAITVFAMVGIWQLYSLARLTEKSGEKQSLAIKDISEESMMETTKQNMIVTNMESAALIESEMWTWKHDLNLLAKEVETIFRHPERFSEVEVEPPKKENGGRFSTQLLKAEDVDPSDAKALSMIKKYANLAPLMQEIIEDNEGYVLDCFLATPAGYCIAVDTMADKKLNGEGLVDPYDVTNRQWYQGAVQKKGFYVTPMVHSYFYGISEIMFSRPVYVEEELAAVLQGCIQMKAVRKKMSQISFGSNSFSILINSDGQIMYSPKETGDVAIDDEFSHNLFDSGNEELIALVKRAISGESGFEEILLDGKPHYVAYETVEIVGGTTMMFVSEKYLKAPTEKLLERMDTITKNTLARYRRSYHTSSVLMLLVLVLLVLDAVIMSVNFSQRIVKPINIMTGHVREFAGEDLDFEMEEVYRTGDEIEVLAEAFAEVSVRTKNYIREIMEITEEKNRIDAELSMATQIQTDMLPMDFPMFPDRKEFDLFASMKPAKEVGGDFYDAFLIDDDHLCLVVADVSGKGMPAALYMVISKTLIEYRAKMGGTPAEILSDVNKQLCAKDVEGMFVTVWLGIVTLSTGQVVEANAGHENPAIRRKDGHFEYIEARHGFVLGGLDFSKYKDDSFLLSPGDVLFSYTDGIPEARDASDVMFGVQRMLKALDALECTDMQELVENMGLAMADYAGDAEQYDDMTMLAFLYEGNPSGEENASIRVAATPEGVDSGMAFLEEALGKVDCANEPKWQLKMAMEEILMNILTYSYPDSDGDIDLCLKLKEDGRVFSATITDSGVPFDPLEMEEPDVHMPGKERKAGGLGIFLVKKTMDLMEYEYKDKKNILRIEKRLRNSQKNIKGQEGT